MRILFCAALFIGGILTSVAQSTSDMLLHFGLDVLKTDNRQLFDKAQVGVELNYFVVRHFAVGAGAEIWTNSATSFAMGIRWYPSDRVFLRFRGLIGANDAVAGVGWAKPIGEYWRLEALGDLYLVDVEFGLRAGVSYVIR